MTDKPINPVLLDEPEQTKRPTGLARLPRGVKLGVPITIGVLAIVTVIAVTANQPSRFEAAISSCELEDNTDARLGDEGATLTLDMEGEGEDEIGTLTFDEVFCVLGGLEVPDRVTALMGETRSLDGRQTGEWDGISASWAYHPDSGLDVILTVD